MKKKNENYKEPQYTSVIRESRADEFEIGQCYEDIPAKRLECKKCKSKQFIVGVGSYYTAIKCPKCLWEKNIHNG
jgi:hypothetical protein